MRQRWRDLRAELATTTDPLPWAAALGPRPSDPLEQAAWLTAATAVTAYRERFEVPDHTLMIGPRPSASRPDARAAWDHACLHADRFLARHLQCLEHDQLAELDARQQALLHNPPPFDPDDLERARRSLDEARGARNRAVATRDDRTAPSSPEQLAVQRLEDAAQAHREWRRAAAEAVAIRREIAMELQRRRANSRVATRSLT